MTWLRRQLYGAEFGALSLEWVKANAKRDLLISDDQLFYWLVRHCLGDAEFRSDGTVITIR